MGIGAKPYCKKNNHNQYVFEWKLYIGANDVCEWS